MHYQSAWVNHICIGFRITYENKMGKIQFKKIPLHVIVPPPSHSLTSKGQLCWHCEFNVNIMGPSKPTEMTLGCLRFHVSVANAESRIRWPPALLPAHSALYYWSDSCVCTKLKGRKGGDNTRQLWKCRSGVSDSEKHLSEAVLVKSAFHFGRRHKRHLL